MSGKDCLALFELNEILSSGDDRPHATIDIFDHQVRCLIDSGANMSIVGREGIELFSILGLELDTSYVSTINTADKTAHFISGVFYVPIRFQGELKIITVFAVPTLPTTIILGVNFWKEFNLLLFHDQNGWSCDSLEMAIGKPRGIISFEKLEPYQQKLLNEMVTKFQSIGDGRLGCTHLIRHKILTGDALPIKQRGYQVSPAIQERFGKELKRMIDLDVIEPSFSPWSSPAVLVKKADGRDRLCVDSRKLNSVTVRDSYPLPRVNEILDRLGKSYYLSKIDLNDFFWQIPLSDDSKEKTAFCVPGHGLFQFKRLPFGLHNSAQCSQRLMGSLFGSTDYKVFAYLDDIIIATSTFEEHMEVLNFVFNRLSYAGLTINFAKSQFCLSNLKYLGYVIDGAGLRTDPEKVSTILNFPKPTTYTELKRFIGIIDWYRRFVRNFATHAAPLHDLTKGKSKNKRIEWTSAANKSFTDLKAALTSSPVLNTPDFSQKFSIHCDASDVGLGAVICQGINEAPVAYASRKLKDAETRYSVTERECLAVVFAIEKFRPYIEGYDFDVYTDHSALIWLMRQENPPGRLSRWIMKLSQYQFAIHHRKGVSNVVPDALSRAPVSVDLISFDISGSDQWYVRMLSKVALSPSRFKDWRLVNDRLFFKRPISNDRPDDDQWQLVIPESARKAVLMECHDDPTSGHMGTKKTKAKLFNRYYWPGAGLDVERYVRACEVCKKSKVPNTKRPGLMGKFKTATRPGQMISLDFIGPLPRSTKQNAYLLVICDWVTKFPMIFPIRHQTANKVVDILEHQWISLIGVPEIIIADNGSQFVGKEFKKFTERYGIKKVWFNARYHPQNNPTERTNKVIGNALRSYVSDNHRHWDAKINEIGIALRTATNEVTGYTPYYLMFGREFSYSASDHHGFQTRIGDDETDPVEERAKFITEFQPVFKNVVKRMEKAYEKNKKQYDKTKCDKSYQAGDTVYKRNFVQSNAATYFSAKLAPKFLKCTVLNKISDLIYELADENGANIGKWHIKDLRPP